jgi:hypothetical protein
MNFFLIISYQEIIKEKNQSPQKIPFECSLQTFPTQKLSRNHHRQSKHLIKRYGSFFPLVLGSWIQLHSKHQSTTSYPWTSLRYMQ